MQPIDSSPTGPQIIKLKPIDIAELMAPASPFLEEPDIMIEELFPSSPMSMVPMTNIM
jgi:hypothetical protein